MTASFSAGDGVLDLDGVGKTYGRQRVLSGLSLTFSPGQVAAVLGPNGAGKSTLLGILSTLVPPTTGRVTLSGAPLDRSSPLRRAVGYVGHEPGVYGDLSALQNLALFAGLYGVREPAGRAAELLERVGLTEVRRDAPTRTFSRGMRQRLALARALLHEPEVLLFDEPGSALDPAGVAWLSQELEHERAKGRVVVLVTHDLNAAATARHLVILRRGRLVHDEQRARGFSLEEVRALYQEKTGER